MTTKEKLNQDVDSLVKEGWDLILNEIMKDRLDTVKASKSKKAPRKSKKGVKEEASKVMPKKSLQEGYQAWYSKALPVVKQILPEGIRSS